MVLDREGLDLAKRQPLPSQTSPFGVCLLKKLLLRLGLGKTGRLPHHVEGNVTHLRTLGKGCFYGKGKVETGLGKQFLSSPKGQLGHSTCGLEVLNLD